ncbi:2'-phosphotransferase [Citrus sinensis]|nr:2'-phosphotransferase [Citrus sinensis]
MDNRNHFNQSSSSFSSFAQSNKSGGGRGRGHDIKNDGERRRSRGGGGSKDKIDALGRLLTRILRHMASELNLNMRSDGFVKVEDLLKLNLKTFAQIPLRSHTVDDIWETVESESLLKPILSAEEVSVCVHGTYKRNLDSILESGLKRMKRLHVHFSCGLPTDGEPRHMFLTEDGTNFSAAHGSMRRDVNVLIFLNVRKALADGMKLYISDNKVVLTEGFDGVVPVEYFEKIESWPDRRPISF